MKTVIKGIGRGRDHRKKRKKKDEKRDAQRQYVVIGTLAPIVVEFL